MLRVATLNLLHSHDALRERVEQLIGQLIAESLDYLLLQEVLPKDASGYSAVEHLADALSLPHVLHSQGEGAPSGNTILSKYPLTPIPLEPGTFYPDRLPTIAESTVAGRRVVVMSYHGAWGHMRRLTGSCNCAHSMTSRDRSSPARGRT